MQIAKSGLDKRFSPRYNAKHEGKGVFECMHSEALFLFLNTIKKATASFAAVFCR